MMKQKRLYLFYKTGEKKPSQLLATSLGDAKKQLLLQGIIATKIKQGPKLSKRRLPPRDLFIITRQLAIMLKTGLPLTHCLQLIVHDHPNPCWRYVFTDIQRYIELGHSFSQALARYPDAFPPFYREMIHTAELTGQLDECCFQLAEQQEKTHHLRKKVKSALRYPIFVLCVTVLVVILILVFVLPKFSQLYADFDSELPAFTQLLVTLSDKIQRHGTLYLAGLFLLSGAYVKGLRPKPTWKKHEQALLFTIPIIGTLMQMHSLSVVFHTLSMTQKAGISLLTGLKSAENSVSYEKYQSALADIQQQLAYGISLSRSVEQHSLFPALCIQLIRVGEESGTLDIMLGRLAQIYQQITEETATQLSQKIEPLMMLILGVVVGALVIAIYLPILQIGNVV